MTTRPYTLIAELTYRCPLQCAYCSNPVDLARHDGALGTDDWLRVFTEAEGLGVVQVNLTGGEPALRRDLERLVAGARAVDLYTNLITSGVPLTRARLERLRAAGLDSIQLSFQALSDAWFDHKLAVAAWAKDLGLPLTINVVLHRDTIDHTGAFLALAERLGADKIELASARYLGFALENRAALLPSSASIERARALSRSARDRLLGWMEVLFVVPDYHAGQPASCMSGWGRRYLVITPRGIALPCHAAHTIPGLVFESVNESPLQQIWYSSPGFEAFRGEAWMPDPCR